MERSADWMAQARSDLDHARHDLEAEFYEQRHIDHAERILTFCDDLMAGPDAWRFVASIRAALPALGDELPVRRIVLFGSHASGRATVASDAARRLLLPFGQGVDLLVVYEGPSREDAFATVKKTVPVRGLEPHVYTADEASSRQKLLARMTRDGIVICDEEEPRC